MSLLSKLKSVFGGNDQLNGLYEKIINDGHIEHLKKNTHYWDLKVNELEIYKQTIIPWHSKEKVQFILYLVKKANDFSKGKRSWSSHDEEGQKNSLRNALIHHLFKAKLVMDEEDVISLSDAFVNNRISEWAGILQWPLAPMLNQLQHQYKDRQLSETIKSSLLKIRASLESINPAYYSKDRIKMLDKIDSMIFDSENANETIKPASFKGEDEFAVYANQMIEAMPVEERNRWFQLLPIAQRASGAKPSNKYLEEAKQIFKELGTEKFKKVVNDWFCFIISSKEKELVHTYSYGDTEYQSRNIELVSPLNMDAIKGFVWMCAHFHDNSTLHNISKLAERSFRKIPGRGPAAASVGNACLYVLYKSKGLDGIGLLSRLKLRIKQSGTQSLIEKYLDAAAKEQGVSVYEIEDLAVDDFGLSSGERSWDFEGYKAVLQIAGVGKANLNWFKVDGSPQKSAPAFVKDKHATKFKKLKETVKQVEQSVSAQRDRIDRMLRSERKIPFNNFRQHYLQHGLMSYLAKDIIWNLETAGTVTSAIYLNGQWVNNKNEILTADVPEQISLWHPVKETLDEVITWRNFLIDHKIQQPLKQAFREVYIITDAEFNTKTYSNRMAAHVLKQHQFNSLAKTRGWKYSLLGSYDDGRYNEAAALKLPEYNLRAEYWVDEVNAENEFNDTGIWNFISTDQVRFVDIDTNQAIDLISVPVVAFSEVMRDIDMFVGVASVGNDPAWRDNGGVAAYRDYWQSYSFGDLSEIGKSRKATLQSIVPRLKIRNVATLKDNFLIVKGKLRTYKIHIGSTNILMEPNDQYLCIVPDRGQKTFTENIFLPFEGDAGLSVILSKAFLLAEDDKITDTTITSQIMRS